MEANFKKHNNQHNILQEHALPTFTLCQSCNFGTIFAYDKWKVVESFNLHLPLQEKLARSTLKTEESKDKHKNKLLI
jgi:hypothetical protein